MSASTSNDQKPSWPFLPLSIGEQSAEWLALWKAELEWRAKVISAGDAKAPDPSKLTDELKKAIEP
jgi:hypothetical protein